MNKIFALAAVTAALFTFTPTTAEAGSYRSRIIGKCQHCSGNVYSYYRPVRYSHGRAVYGWVPSYHSKCAASAARARTSRSKYSSSRYYNNSGLYTSRRYYQRPSYRSHRGSGISFGFSFGGNRSCR